MEDFSLGELENEIVVDLLATIVSVVVLGFVAVIALGRFRDVQNGIYYENLNANVLGSAP